MPLSFDDPVGYFNRWLQRPIELTESQSVFSVVETLNEHPLFCEDRAPYYVMPARRYRERAGRFRIFGEHQDNWYFFVYDGDEFKSNPPVYFESCLELVSDHDVSPQEVVDGDHVMVSTRFTTFLWQMIGELICIQTDPNSLLAKQVWGINFKDAVTLDDSFQCPLDRANPVGYTCRFKPDTIAISDWGAAFLDTDSGHRFLASYTPAISRTWYRPDLESIRIKPLHK